MNTADTTLLEELTEKLLRREITGVSIDSRNISEGELFVALRGDRFDGHDFVSEVLRNKAWGALVEQTALAAGHAGLQGQKNVLPVLDTLAALQDMSFLLRGKFPIPVVGITGSNGKTTTKEMLAAILMRKGPALKNAGNLNNHIGVPLTLLKLTPDHQAAVVEMGMSAPGEIRALARLVRPTIGVITNIGPAHLEFFGSMENVAMAKAELLENLDPAAIAVLNADDPFVGTLRKRFAGRTMTFGVYHDADVSASQLRQGPDHQDFTITAGGRQESVRLRAPGTHNVYNALAAAASALAAGMPLDAVAAGLDGFSPVAMRSEIKEVRDRTILADYYNANPASMDAAVAMLVSLFPGKRSIAVLGDMLELGDGGAEAHRELGRTAARRGVDIVITFGKLARFIGDGAREAGMPEDRVRDAPAHADAARYIQELSLPGDVILIKGSRGMKMEKILEAF